MAVQLCPLAMVTKNEDCFCTKYLLYLLQQRLKEYFLGKEGGENLFIEDQVNGLTHASQGIVYQYIFDYIKEEYTINAKSAVITDVCNAAIDLFVSLKHGGIVRQTDQIFDNELFLILINYSQDSLYNLAARKGIIYQKIRYGKTKSKLQSESDPKRIRHENGSDGSETEQSENETTLISFLQSCVLPEDLPRIKQKFEETVQLRRKMMIEIDKYEQLLDLYLASPELVKLINTNVFFLLKL